MPRKKKNDQDGAAISGGKYIDLHDASSSQIARMKLLYIFTGIFGVILIVIWLNSIKISLTSQSDFLGLSRLSEEIQNGIAKYDQGLDNGSVKQTSTSPVINLTAISNSVEGDIFMQSSTEGWLEKSFMNGAIILRYPSQWLAKSSGQIVTLTSSTTQSTSTQLRIESLANLKRLALGDWLKSKPKEPGEMSNDAATLLNSASSTILKYSSTSNPYYNIYYLASTNSQQVIKIMARAEGADNDLKIIFERIIQNIELIK